MDSLFGLFPSVWHYVTVHLSPISVIILLVAVLFFVCTAYLFKEIRRGDTREIKALTDGLKECHSERDVLRKDISILQSENAVQKLEIDHLKQKVTELEQAVESMQALVNAALSQTVKRTQARNVRRV